jgi:transposase
MKKIIRSFVGMDVHKATISISVAEDGRGGTVRFIGVIPNTPEAVGKMAKQLARHGELDFCYEASGCGYGVHRQLTSLGHKCIVVAPSLIPRKSGERIKTDRRDSEKLAILHRSGDLTPVWVPDPTHEALRGLRGIDLISAVTFIASTGDLSRFESPRLLMGYLGLVPSEHSSGGTIRRGGITKTGNREARRMLIEAAWSYQYPARIAKEKAEILVRLPKNIRDIAWKAQTRLCTRYRSLIAKGKKSTVVVAAIARELAGFIWAIGREMRLPMTA